MRWIWPARPVEVRVGQHHRRALCVQRLDVERPAAHHRAARVELVQLVQRHLVPDVLGHDRDVGADDAGVGSLHVDHEGGRRGIVDALHVLHVVRVDDTVRRDPERERHVRGGERLAVAPPHARAQLVGDRQAVRRLRVGGRRRVLEVGRPGRDADVQQGVVHLVEDEVRRGVVGAEDVGLGVDVVAVRQAPVGGEVAARVRIRQGGGGSRGGGRQHPRRHQDDGDAAERRGGAGHRGEFTEVLTVESTFGRSCPAPAVAWDTDARPHPGRALPRDRPRPVVVGAAAAAGGADEARPRPPPVPRQVRSAAGRGVPAPLLRAAASCVLDPFMGSGTTLVEASALGDGRGRRATSRRSTACSSG